MQLLERKPVSPTSRPVVPWNKGAFVGPKPPLKPKQVWSIRLTPQRDGRIRDLALFDLAVDSKLRGCDLVKLRIGQLVINAAARHCATIVQQKTGKPVPARPTGSGHFQLRGVAAFVTGLVVRPVADGGSAGF